jgi:glycogen(starch) synthase
MKVLMTADPIGGVWTYALELVEGLADRGVDVTLAVMGAPLAPDQQDDLQGSPVRRIYSSCHPLEWMEEPWSGLDQAGEWLLRIQDEVEPDIVHLNGYVHANLPWSAPIVVVGHSCVLSWHEAVHGHQAGPEWNRYREEVERGLCAAGLIVAPTRAMLDDLRRLYVFATPTRVVPNGRRLDVPPVTKREMVVSAGRLWDDGKNVQALARVAPRLPWTVAFAGEGYAGNGVQALGRLSRRELEQAFARAAVYVSPARYEPFGMAPLEAAIAGCALVLGDIASLREVWGTAAVFVSPDDEERLAWELLALIQDERRRLDLAGRARRRARRYSREAMAGGYVDAYQQLASVAKRALA